jgi:Zn-dependent protease with chaperone function
MIVRRRWLPAVCFTLVFSCLAPRLCPAQRTSAPPVTAQATGVPTQPATQAYTLPPDKLAKAIAINRIRNILDIVGGLWSIAVLWLLLATRAAAAFEAWAQRIFSRRWLQGLLFFAALLVITTLASLPLDVFGHHVSRAYGISVQGWGSWLGDQGKALGLLVLFLAPILLLFNWIVRRWPRRYWFGIWLVTLPLLVIALFVSPLFEPLFNKYEPLSKNHAALVDKLETVVARTATSIPPDRMFLMIASAKTNGLNAYVNGIGATKRIVVWDTTAGRIPDDEVMFVFGHESGHYVLNHIPKMLTGIAIALFFVYWACAAFAAWLARRFGASWRLQPPDGSGAPSFAPFAKGGRQDPVSPSSEPSPLSTRSGFVVLIFAVTVAGFVLEPASNTFSRHFEHQADVYGQEAIHGLVPDPQKTAVAGFQALGEAWLEDPNPSPIIEFWEYNHPSVKARANFAANYNPWANGGRGEFFDK